MSARIIVVGTTPDYIEWLRQTAPKRGLFLTLPEVRAAARPHETPPPSAEEILTALDDLETVCQELMTHCVRYKLAPTTLRGVVAFDCEHLLFAAQLAEKLSLPYSPPHVIQNCRDKYRAKILWQKNQVPCPRSAIIENVAQLREWLAGINPASCVLKPISGAGSELTFHCENSAAAVIAYAQIKAGLQVRRAEKLFADARIIAEEFIAADEYSADFIITNNEIKIIRVCRKHKDAFGITGAYELLTPPEFAALNLEPQLARAASALGLTHTLAMADFFLPASTAIAATPLEYSAIFLEITPRAGGDCLPWLLREAANFDSLNFALNFAATEKIALPRLTEKLIGLRVFAPQRGELTALDFSVVARAPRVKQSLQKRDVGTWIELPPNDWNTWLLGHIIYQPDLSPAAPSIAAQNAALRRQVAITIMSPPR